MQFSSNTNRRQLAKTVKHVCTHVRDRTSNRDGLGRLRRCSRVIPGDMRRFGCSITVVQNTVWHDSLELLEHFQRQLVASTDPKPEGRQTCLEVWIPLEQRTQH